MHRYLASLPILAGVLALFGVRPAFAAVPDCSALRIEAAPELSAHWPELLNQLRAALDARDDIDHCAGIRLLSRDGSVAVEVTLPDGRSAMRMVSGPEDIVPTLESLLLVPELMEQEQTSPLEPSRWKPPPPKGAAALASAPR